MNTYISIGCWADKDGDKRALKDLEKFLEPTHGHYARRKEQFQGRPEDAINLCFYEAQRRENEASNI